MSDHDRRRLRTAFDAELSHIASKPNLRARALERALSEPRRGGGGMAAVAAVVLAVLVVGAFVFVARSQHAATPAPAGGSTTAGPYGVPPARYEAAAAYDDTRGAVVIFGGFDGKAFLADTWAWDGQGWRQQLPAKHPSARAGAAMAYDPITRRVILFGGRTGDYGSAVLNDTWAWERDAWTRLDVGGAPSGRSGAVLVADPTAPRLLLYGGSTATGELSDTWAFQEGRWAQLNPPASPPAGQRLAAAPDPAGSQVVLAVLPAKHCTPGQPCGPSPMPDTYSWDGQTWRLITRFGGPYPGGIIWDPDRQELLVVEAPYHSGDMWMWRSERAQAGIQWVRVRTEQMPPPRSGAILVYDLRNHRAVLFGGVGISSLPQGVTAMRDTWLWDGTDWQLVPESGLSKHQVSVDGVLQARK